MTNITVHYAALCDKPACLCVGMSIMAFLRDGLFTTEDPPKPFVSGIVTEVHELDSGGVDVKIDVDESVMPLDGDDALIAPSFGEGGSLCDPLCSDECQWVADVMRLINWPGKPALVNRAYELFTSAEPVDDGTFKLPRIPFGLYHLLKIAITCYTYDPGTTLDIEVKVGSTVIASYSGELNEIKFLTIVVDDLTLDQLPEVVITNVLSDVYEDAAKGLVIEFIGVV